jgi:hypothetical protein
MAKKNKAKTKKDKRRQERRFVSQSSASPALLGVIGGLSALVLGAGVWAYLFGKSFASDDKLVALPQYLIAGGAVLAGITLWIGTATEPPLRVGAPGIAVEKGELRRMPWWAVDKISFDSVALALVVKGKDESGADFVIKVPVKAHAEAAGHIVQEALDRIPRRVEIEEAVLEKLPRANESAGERIDLDALQVVGKKCAATGKTISYEPDARVCARCERVYFHTSVPKKCKCGNSLAHLRPTSEQDSERETTDESDVDSAEQTTET